jgi:hypothetical protein
LIRAGLGLHGPLESKTRGTGVCTDDLKFDQPAQAGSAGKARDVWSRVDVMREPDSGLRTSARPGWHGGLYARTVFAP